MAKKKAKKPKPPQKTRVVITLDIEGGDESDACDVVDRLLDGGLLQDAINGFEGDAPALKVTSALVRPAPETTSTSGRKLTVLVSNDILEQPSLVAVCSGEVAVSEAIRDFVGDVVAGLRTSADADDRETADEMEALSAKGKAAEAVELWEDSQHDGCLLQWETEVKGAEESR